MRFGHLPNNAVLGEIHRLLRRRVHLSLAVNQQNMRDRFPFLINPTYISMHELNFGRVIFDPSYEAGRIAL